MIERCLIANITERVWSQSTPHAEAVAIGCAFRNRCNTACLAGIAMEPVGDFGARRRPKRPAVSALLCAAKDVFCSSQADAAAGPA